MNTLRFSNVKLHKDELYLNGEYDISDDGTVKLECGDSLSTDTLFGTLSVGKWHRYTDIDNIRLCIVLSGSMRLTVYRAYLEHGSDSSVLTDVVTEAVIDTDGKVCKCFDIPLFDEGLLYFVVDEVSRESFIYDAYYCTDRRTVADVRLAINICTYKRFEYLKRNIDLIKRELLIPDDLSDKIDIFVTDNASELDKNVFADSRIKVFHNRNLGGTGGFTNGLIQMLKSGQHYTHVLFMDDDAFIETESIRRTYAMLAIIRTEYKGYFISGSNNRAENRCIQHENGALWNNGRCRFIGRGLDMRNVKDLLANEKDQERDYAAWWYCCIPMETVREDNLPAPFFLHQDDVEYSLRNAKGMITLNGIAIWHPCKMHRRMSVNVYYDLRNILTVNAVHRPGFRSFHAIVWTCGNLMVSLCRHRYKDMNMVARAVEDYLKGPEYLMSIDGEALHASLQKDAYRFEYVGNLLKDENTLKCLNESFFCSSGRGLKAMWRESGSLSDKLKVIAIPLSIYGWLLPRRHRTEAHYMNAGCEELFRAGRLILFDDTDNYGLVLDKDFKQLFIMIGKMIRLSFMLFFGYGKVARAYRARWKEMTNMSYWTGILENNERNGY